MHCDVFVHYGIYNVTLSTANSLYREIRAVLEDARHSAYRVVNFAMVRAYWQIGHLIVEQEQTGQVRAEYGRAVLRGLSDRLGKRWRPRCAF